MKTEAVATKPPAESTGPSRAAHRDAKDAPADLFALLLSAAEGENPTAMAVMAESPESSSRPQDEANLKGKGSQETETDEPAIALMTPLVQPDLKLGQTPEPKSESSRPGVSELGGPGQWVSTVAKARPRAAPPALLTEMPQNLPAAEVAQGMTADPMRSAWHAGSAGQPASLLAERLGEPESVEQSALNVALAERSGEQREGGQSGQRGEPGRVMLESAGQVRSAATDGGAVRSFADMLGDAMGAGMDQAFEQLGDQISLWAAGQTRKASLTLQAGLREAMEVDVSLLGDKAELAFRTDDGEVREAIRAHAHTLLADMLSQAGLDLESLSVGGRDAGESGQSSQGREESSARQSGRGNDETVEVARLLRQQSGNGLSVYA